MSGLNSIASGLITGIDDSSTTVKIVVAVFLSTALYNAIELSIVTLLTFHRYHGLYFWSMLISNVAGIIPTTVGAFLHFFTVGPLWLALAISHIGFYAMVPVQSLVLYSRLHLVYHSENGLRVILCLILVVSTVLVIPTTISMFGSAFISTPSWNKAYQIIERLQLTGFCVQEFSLSSLYIYETIKLLKLSPEKRSRRKRIMYELLVINLVIIILDIALLVMEYLSYYYMQVSLKSLVYSIKLKLEFAVLGKLVSLTDTSRNEPMGSDPSEFPEFVDPAYTSTDFTHALPMDTRRSSGSKPEEGLIERT